LVNGSAEAAVAQNLLGRILNLFTGLMGNKFEGTQPDIVIDDEYDLNEHGISGKIIHTPGHSRSSVSILLDNGEALVGDLVRDTGSGRIGLGMFCEDKRVALESVEKVAAFDPKRIYLSHGTYIDNSTLKDFVASSR
jgi:glyoxylase-like metal-dependent hydrolase (beta-lactamase superfamily II)